VQSFVSYTHKNGISNPAIDACALLTLTSHVRYIPCLFSRLSKLVSKIRRKYHTLASQETSWSLQRRVSIPFPPFRGEYSFAAKHFTGIPLTRVYYTRLVGFLLGSTLTGVGVYYYVLEEYKVSNE